MIFLERLPKYLSVFLISTFKFVFGPITGIILELNPIEIWIFTVLGMMTTVFILIMLGIPFKAFLKKRSKKRRLFTRRNRFIIKTQRRYGAWGIAFFTPLIFSPIVGTLIIIALGYQKKIILSSMFVWANIWAFILSFGFYLLSIWGYEYFF